MLMKISYEQMRILDENAARSFENRMVRHIARVFPEHLRKLGESRARKLIREGVVKAATYGIQAELPVALFIDLMVSIDPEFDTLPALRWAQDILNDKKYSGKSRMNMIYYQLPYKENEANLQADLQAREVK